MILKNGYYYDDNDNCWNSLNYTEDQAQGFSDSLIGCRCCSDCRGCSNCSYFKSNPQRYVSQNMGSRNAQTTIFFLENRTMIICGCWNGTIDEFETRVNNVYPEGVKHGDDYRKLITLMRKIIGGAL